MWKDSQFVLQHFFAPVPTWALLKYSQIQTNPLDFSYAWRFSIFLNIF